MRAHCGLRGTLGSLLLVVGASAFAWTPCAPAASPGLAPRLMTMDVKAPELGRLAPGATTVVQVPLPWSVIDDAGTALEVRDASGALVPHEVLVPAGSPPVAREATLVSSTRRGTATRHIFELGASAGPAPVRVVLVIADEIFDAAVTVGVARDGDAPFRVVARDVPLFRRRSGERVEVIVPASGAPWRRLCLDVAPVAGTSAIGLSGASVEIPAAGAASSGLVDAEILEQVDGAEQTWLRVRLPARNVSVRTVRVEVAGGPNRRAPMTVAVPERAGDEVALKTVASGELDFAASSWSAPVAAGSILASREVVLVIENGHQSPLAVRTIRFEVERPLLRMRLGPGQGHLRLLLGLPAAATAIRGLEGEEPSLSLHDSSVAFGPIENNPDLPAPVTADLVPEFAGEIDTGEWEYRKEVRVAMPGVQRLELDPEVLAHAARDGRDLRLVSGSRQVPFLIQRSGIPSVVRPGVEKIRSGSVSGWKLTLPAAPLPALQVTARTTARVFRRSIRILERVVDESGKSVDRVLGSEHFLREGSSEGELVIAFQATPSTKELILEVENGENAEIDLADFKVLYEGSRLYFRRMTPGPTWLYFGSAAAQAPHYDLELVEHEVLASASSVASAGSLERVNPAPWWRTVAGGRATTWAYWGVLVILVITLIAVIARLATSSPGSAPRS